MDPTGSYYPPVSFYFQLAFGGVSMPNDNAFQEASGLSTEWEIEEVKEGGLNIYKHRLPTVVKHSNLVLKRGFVTSGSPLAVWCADALSSDFTTPIAPQDMVLSLLDSTGAPLAAWTFREAWPVKWSMSEFRAQENALAIETMEFAFANIQPS